MPPDKIERRDHAYLTRASRCLGDGGVRRSAVPARECPWFAVPPRRLPGSWSDRVGIPSPPAGAHRALPDGLGLGNVRADGAVPRRSDKHARRDSLDGMGRQRGQRVRGHASCAPGWRNRSEACPRSTTRLTARTVFRSQGACLHEARRSHAFSTRRTARPLGRLDRRKRLPLTATRKATELDASDAWSSPARVFCNAPDLPDVWPRLNG
jgi:hypothetical protein